MYIYIYIYIYTPCWGHTGIIPFAAVSVLPGGSPMACPLGTLQTPTRRITLDELFAVLLQPVAEVQVREKRRQTAEVTAIYEELA